MSASKRRRIEEPESFAQKHKPNKPSAKYAIKSKGRHSTISVAIPGSILLNAQSEELKAVLASQIARYCAIFEISEIVVFHEEVEEVPQIRPRGKHRKRVGVDAEPVEDVDQTLARMLEYLETPQYLRRALFPMHPSLRLVGIMPPLDMPHHLRKSDRHPFREGVVLRNDDASGMADVDIGLDEPINARGSAATGTRVTVHLDNPDGPKIVAPTVPRTTMGIPWGYTVRVASSIATALIPPAPSKPYDLIIGLSERGTNIHKLPQPDKFNKYSRALLVIGGLAGLELSIEREQAVLGVSADDSADLFDHWINICPNQGSRTIRTEEALGIGLAVLRERLLAGMQE